MLLSVLIGAVVLPFPAGAANNPTFRNVEVTEAEHVIHASNISEGGLTGANNRNLIDYFLVSFDSARRRGHCLHG